MFYLLGHSVGISILPSFIGSMPVYTVVAWLIILGLYQLLIEILRRIFIHTKTQVDELILSILREPVRILLIAFGFLDVLRSFVLPAGWFDTLAHFDDVVIIGVVTNIAWKILSRVILQIAQRKAEESESAVDDVIVPIMGTFGRIAVILFVILATLNVFGIKLTTLLGVLGGLSFLLIILFQEPLSNLFSGVYLWMDAPFKLYDLIITDDGTTYQVQRIGARVSRLYNLNDHTVAHIPNSNLSGQRLINLTQPNTELKATVTIGIAYSSDPTKVSELLSDIANSHPNVLGIWEKKQKAIETQMKIIPSESRDWWKIQVERLRSEYEARDLGELISRELILLGEFVSAIEENGLSPNEKLAVQQQALHIIAQVRDLRRLYTQWLAAIGYLAAHYKDEDSAKFDDIIKVRTKIEKEEIPWLAERIGRDDNAKSELMRGGLLPAVMGFFESIGDMSPERLEAFALEWKTQQPTSSVVEDFEKLYKFWYRAFHFLRSELAELTDLRRMPLEEQTQVDDKINALAVWFNGIFLLPVPKWQLPDVNFVNHGELSLDFRLEFFIDDLSGDHFKRGNDITTKIRTWITERFEQEHIEIPFPQTDIWFRSALEAHRPKI